MEERYKAKIQAMQVYVPLLAKLIKNMNDKCEATEDGTENIAQLQTLLQQLSDPKPGISFKELNECHQVMENLFKLNKKDSSNVCLTNDKTKKKTDHLSPKKQLSIDFQYENKEEIFSSVTKEEENVQEFQETSNCMIPTYEMENVEFIEILEDEGNEHFELEDIIFTDPETEFQSEADNNNKQNIETAKEKIEKLAQKNEECDKRTSRELKEGVASFEAKDGNFFGQQHFKPQHKVSEVERIRTQEMIFLRRATTKILPKRRTFDESVDNNVVPQKKKVKLSSSLGHIHLEENTTEITMETIADPLAVEVSKLGHNIINDTRDDDDDIEIIENRSSPILIESDIEVDEKEQMKRKENKKVVKLPTNVEIQLKRTLIQKPVDSIRAPKSKEITKIVKITPPQRLVVATPKTKFCSNVNLQPRTIDGKAKNLRLITTRIGDKPLQIPNAYQNAFTRQLKNQTHKDTNIAQSDEAHCHWLDNFLRHFCSPFNIVHNTCFLLLQRALRISDFKCIYEKRLALKTSDGEINKQLLSALRAIFYVNGDHQSRKLTFIGRKFCNLAFVNIFDKSISLCVDSRTNGVTSRTRISGATLESVPRNSATSQIRKTPLQPTRMITNTRKNPTPIPKSIPPRFVQGNESLHTRKSVEKDAEYCPPTDIVENSAETGQYFTYSDDNDDDDYDEAVQETSSTILPNQNKQIIEAAVNEFDLKKRLAAKPEQQTRTQTFETAFISAIKNNKTRTTLSSKKNDVTTTNSPTQTLIISDDEDETPSTATTQEKELNIFRNVHPLSSFSDYCVICERIVDRLVGHYVNSHPDHEVFISRPTPKFVEVLLNNRLGKAVPRPQKNRPNFFVATCAFCEKKCCYTFYYWYQHFASHTGEYPYKCSGCGFRTPTPSHLSKHVEKCKQGAKLVATIKYDYSATKISAYMCCICNYVQMNFWNVVRHLKTEHGYARVEKQWWTNVSLLEIPKPAIRSKTLNTLYSNEKIAKVGKTSKIIIRDCNGDVFEIADVEDRSPTPFVMNEAEVDKFDNEVTQQIV